MATTVNEEVRLLTIKEFAGRLGVSRARAFRFLAEDPHAPKRVTVGGRPRLRSDDVARYIERLTEQSLAPVGSGA